MIKFLDILSRYEAAEFGQLEASELLGVGERTFRRWSRRAWLADQPALDLIVTLDDATSTVYSAFLVAEEGTASTFRALEDVFGRHGLPLSLYTDRGSHYFYTPDAGGKVDRTRLTQVGRALAHLGSSTSRPIRPRRGDARNACSARCRTG